MVNLEKTAQVWCICGNLGGGKTLTAVSMAFQAMEQGYFVVSNVTLDIDQIKKKIPFADRLYQHIVVRSEEYDDLGNLIKCDDFNPFTIPSGSPRGTDNGKRVLVILDECAEWFDQYANARSNIMKRVKSWLRHTSKRSQDVVFIVQKRSYLHKDFRVLVSRWINVEDLAVYRIPVLRIHIPFMEDYCIVNVFDKSDNSVSSPSFVAKSVFGKYYNTAECLSNFGGVSSEYQLPEKRVDFPFWVLIFLFSSSLLLIFCKYL